MDLTIPTTWAISWAQVAAVVGFCATTVWIVAGAWSRIMARFDKTDARLEKMDERMGSMEARNTVADRETVTVKLEQAAQHTEIAVMAEQMRSQGATLARIDRNLEALAKDLRERKS